MATEYVSIGEAARRLGVSAFLLRRRIAAGEIRSFADPLDRRLRLLALQDLERYRTPRPLPLRREGGAAVPA